MLAGNDAQRNRVMTLAVPGPLKGIKSSYSRAQGSSIRFSPYDGVNDNVDVPGAGAGPKGRQSAFRGSVQRVITNQPSQINQPFAQIDSMFDNRPKTDIGGNPQSSLRNIQMSILARQGIQTPQFGGGRGGQPDMTDEVASENGISSYPGFTGAPNFFPKYQGAPGAEPAGWGLTAPRKPTGLDIDLPNPNPGANGGGSDGLFQTTRSGSATFYNQNPFATVNWKQVMAQPIRDVVESAVNQPMLYSTRASRTSARSLAGTQIAFDESHEGQLMYQAIEDLGTLRQATIDKEGMLSPDKLPHTLFNLVSANYFLATSEKQAGPLQGWKINDVLARIVFHGIIRGDSSARFGPGERFELSRRIYNCNVGGGIEFMFNDWGDVQLGQEVWHLIKRVPHKDIRASPKERPGSYSLTGAAENILLVPDDKTRRPFQIVPWVGKYVDSRPTTKDVEYIDDDGIKCEGVAIKIGIVFQIDFPSPYKVLTDHSSYSNFYRTQCPVIGVMLTPEPPR